MLWPDAAGRVLIAREGRSLQPTGLDWVIFRMLHGGRRVDLSGALLTEVRTVRESPISGWENVKEHAQFGVDWLPNKYPYFNP